EQDPDHRRSRLPGPPPGAALRRGRVARHRAGRPELPQQRVPGPGAAASLHRVRARLHPRPRGRRGAGGGEPVDRPLRQPGGGGGDDRRPHRDGAQPDGDAQPGGRAHAAARGALWLVRGRVRDALAGARRRAHGRGRRRPVRARGRRPLDLSQDQVGGGEGGGRVAGAQRHRAHLQLRGARDGLPGRQARRPPLPAQHRAGRAAAAERERGADALLLVLHGHAGRGGAGAGPRGAGDGLGGGVQHRQRPPGVHRRPGGADEPDRRGDGGDRAAASHPHGRGALHPALSRRLGPRALPGARAAGAGIPAFGGAGGRAAAHDRRAAGPRATGRL
ncbi:MAG: hypothetical protein AVDCRST_MAG68-1295, partial [uncultured Gemmatimonadetes bacterium]